VKQSCKVERFGVGWFCKQDFDPEARKIICRTLRFVAHRHGAHLQVCVMLRFVAHCSGAHVQVCVTVVQKTWI